ncbi:spore wall maturation protein DIT1 [Podospora australis]|uniref:Spore wall maturation protein DIT1 n=1 Tax=Podospora australis TaxID=1536484 RepID=A0AAN7AGF3_9PEZI|nr:spore wall maturation protein DIT1 [Podospora australis]
MEFGNDGQSVYHRYQLELSSKGAVIALGVGNPEKSETRSDFDVFFTNLVLDQRDTATKDHHQFSVTDPARESTTCRIVDLFDVYLRYEGKNDQWVASGREYFAQHVNHFTSQNAAIEFCLPAFPCKSSNVDKVLGPDPDRGEELALERLHEFVEAIGQIYPPGAKVWVISDGHVFSDCIGVDDCEVDRYGQLLKNMNHMVGLRFDNPDGVGFKSLVDLFQLASQPELSALASRLQIPVIDHHIDTVLTDEAELCRRILMTGCAPRRESVRANIDSKDQALTALYRGFSRFMLEDLEHHPHTQKMSRAKRKKLSSSVAFEMILRNQAYSNLVELLFPNHIRLSIHAHNNAGPKFGIQMFDPTKVRAVSALSPNGELTTSLDLLHIPTPWHNCVVELEGSDVILVTKAKLARTALEKGSCMGSISHTGSGSAYFSLAKGQKRHVADIVTEKISNAVTISVSAIKSVTVTTKTSTPTQALPEMVVLTFDDKASSV